jgi:hypothetical protein
MSKIHTMAVTMDDSPEIGKQFAGLDDGRKGIVATLISFMQLHRFFEADETRAMIGEPVLGAIAEAVASAQHSALSALITVSDMKEDEYDDMVARAEKASDAILTLMHDTSDAAQAKEAGHVQ